MPIKRQFIHKLIFMRRMLPLLYKYSIKIYKYSLFYFKLFIIVPLTGVR